MKLNELLEEYDVSEELSTKVAFLLAYFGALSVKEDEESEEETISGDDLYCYDWNEIEVSDYDLECGAYHNGIWFSLEKIIKVLVKCEQAYD